MDHEYFELDPALDGVGSFPHLLDHFYFSLCSELFPAFEFFVVGGVGGAAVETGPIVDYFIGYWFFRRLAFKDFCCFFDVFG